MFDHLSLQDMKRHLERALSPKEVIVVDDHLASCNVCYERFKELGQLPAKLEPLRINLSVETDEGPQHLLYDEQIVAYVDSKLDEIDCEIVESHISICPLCAEDVRDLQKFKNALDVPSRKKVTPLRQPTLSEKLFVSLNWSTLRWRPLHVASLLVIIVLTLLVGMFLLRSKVFEWHSPLVEQNNSTPTNKQKTQTADIPANNGKKEGDQKQAQNDDREEDVNGTVNKNRRKIYPAKNRDASATSVVIVLKDGDLEITLDSEGRLAGLDSFPTATQQAVRATLVAEKIKKPTTLSSLSGISGKLRDGSLSSQPFSLLSPAKIIVREDRPTFRWQPLNGACCYIVIVSNIKTNQVVKSEILSATEWTIPHPLSRGGIYSWQVTALKNDSKVIVPTPPAPEVKFKVLEEEKAAELERAIKTSANSRLILGVLYARQGLVDEAEKEFQSLVNSNPRSRVAKKLLQSVQSWRNR